MTWIVTGTWVGQYWYNPNPESTKLPPPCRFGLRLAQSGCFSTVRGKDWEEPIRGMPGPGIVKGRAGRDYLRFFKWMPVCYVISKDLRLITLGEHMELEYGQPLDQPVPHPPIRYFGKCDSTGDKLEGRWELISTLIEVTSRGQLVRLGSGTANGRWTAQRVSDHEDPSFGQSAADER